MNDHAIERLENKNKDTQTRRKYLRAVGFSLGADPKTCLPYIETLLDSRDTLDGLKLPKDYREADSETLAQIMTIGSTFLEGSPQAQRLQYTAGTLVITLLRDDMGSKTLFTNVRERINYWTDGEGLAAFDQFMSRADRILETTNS